jgi:hypothetical protein
MSGIAITPGARVSAEVAGSFNSFTNSANTFRGKFKLQLQMLGLDVERIDIEVGGAVERIITLQMWTEEDYKASLLIKTNAPMNDTSLVATIMSAAEQAGGLSGTAVTLTNRGQVGQPLPSSDPGILGTAIRSVGEALEGVAKVPEAVAKLPTYLIVGLVVIVALVAFGPNVKAIARAAR